MLESIPSLKIEYAMDDILKAYLFEKMPRGYLPACNYSKKLHGNLSISVGFDINVDRNALEHLPDSYWENPTITIGASLRSPDFKALFEYVLYHKRPHDECMKTIQALSFAVFSLICLSENNHFIETMGDKTDQICPVTGFRFCRLPPEEVFEVGASW